MALDQGIQAGKAFVEFVASDKKLDGQLARIGTKFRKVGAIGSAAMAPVIAAFTASVVTFAAVGDELGKLSDRTDVSVESLSELKFAAEQSDATLADVEKAMRVLQDKGIDPLRFDEIAADIAAIEDPTKRAQAAMNLFGKKTGSALLPMLRDLPQLRQQARDLGLTMSGEQAAAATKLGDAVATLRSQFTAIAIQIGAAVAGPLTEFLTWSSGVVANVIQWIKENPRLVRGIAAATLAIAACSAAAFTFGVILAVLTAHPIIAALTLIAALVLGVAAYFGLASDAAGDFKNSLNGVKMAGASPNAGLTAQSQQVQRQLSTAMRGGTVQPVATAVAAPAALAKDYGQEIAKWTRATAEGLAYLVRITRNSPVGILGSF